MIHSPDTSPPAPPARTSGAAITSLVLGILALFTFAITALPAIIFGHVARAGIRKSGGLVTGKGLALTGLILGYLTAATAITVVTATALYFTERTVITSDANVEDFARRAELVIPASAKASDYRWSPGMDSLAQLKLEMPAGDLDGFLEKSNLADDLTNTTRTKAFKHVYRDLVPAVPPTKFREGQKALSGGDFLNVLVDEDSPTRVIIYLVWFEV